MAPRCAERAAPDLEHGRKHDIFRVDYSDFQGVLLIGRAYICAVTSCCENGLYHPNQLKQFASVFIFLYYDRNVQPRYGAGCWLPAAQCRFVALHPLVLRISASNPLAASPNPLLAACKGILQDLEKKSDHIMLMINELPFADYKGYLTAPHTLLDVHQSLELGEYKNYSEVCQIVFQLERLSRCKFTAPAVPQRSRPRVDQRAAVLPVAHTRSQGRR